MSSLKSFKNFSEEKINQVVATFGRFNPPTTGHELLILKVQSLATGNNYRIFVSQSNDPKKNPLKYADKIKYMRKMFPEHGRNIILDTKVDNALHALVKLYKEGYNKVIWVVGSDRVSSFKNLLTKYNGVESRHGYYNFPYGIVVKSAGERDPDNEDVSGMSASKMRSAAANNDLKSFSSGLPKSFRGAVELLNAVRIGMGLKPTTTFREEIELDTTELREKYVAGSIFKVDEIVKSKKDNQLYVIRARYNNYVSAESVEAPNNIKKFFIENIVQCDEDYYSGLSKSTSDKRSAQFNKQAAMDDDNPNAYKPAPGDARAKTKLSKYTKAYHDKYSKDENHMLEDVETALKKKSEESGISYDILKKVFDRGMAAWRTGHRPGATQHQWGYARVNSFIVGGKTQKTTDADLWAKHKGQ